MYVPHKIHGRLNILTVRRLFSLLFHCRVILSRGLFPNYRRKMRKNNRDLLLLSKKNLLTSEDINAELLGINDLLYKCDNLATYRRVNEVIDINRYKVIKKPYLVEKYLREKNHLNPFVFLFNKN